MSAFGYEEASKREVCEYIRDVHGITLRRKLSIEELIEQGKHIDKLLVKTCVYTEEYGKESPGVISEIKDGLFIIAFDDGDKGEYKHSDLAIIEAEQSKDQEVEEDKEVEVEEHFPKKLNEHSYKPNSRGIVIGSMPDHGSGITETGKTHADGAVDTDEETEKIEV